MICQQRFDDFGCFLKSSFKTIPIIWGKECEYVTHDIYHFPNNFDLNVSKKLMDIFKKSNEVGQRQMPILNQTDIKIDMKIMNFEIFKF